MNCSEFKQWLDTDLSDEDTSAKAGKHADMCDACKKLHVLDSFLEAKIRNDLEMVAPPERLINRIDMNIRSAENEKYGEKAAWKKAAYAFAVAAMVLIIFNPFSTKFQGMDEISALTVKDHTANLSMAFKAGEIRDVPRWFEDKLGYTISMADLKTHGLKLLGGRKCHLGGNDVAYLFCEKEGKKISLFIMDADDIDFDMEEKGVYSMTVSDCDVDVWKRIELVYAMVR